MVTLSSLTAIRSILGAPGSEFTVGFFGLGIFDLGFGVRALGAWKFRGLGIQGFGV